VQIVTSTKQGENIEFTKRKWKSPASREALDKIVISRFRGNQKLFSPLPIGMGVWRQIIAAVLSAQGTWFGR